MFARIISAVIKSFENLLPVLLVFALLIGIYSLISFVSGKVRLWRLKKFARDHGYTFGTKSMNDDAPFATHVFDKKIWPSYKAYDIGIVMRGNIEGMAFVYFEQEMILTSKIAPARASTFYWHSIVAVPYPASEHFDCDADDDWSLEVKREGDWIYFLWDKRNVIPIRKLKKFFAEVVSLVRPNLPRVPA